MTRGLFAAMVAACALAPLWLSSYGISFCVSLFMAVAIAGSWNLFSGLTGYASLGHGIFFGLGAYAFAIAMAVLKWHPVLAFFSAGFVTAAAALLMGCVLLTTRIRIAYFAIVMLGFNEIAKTLFANVKAIGSANGLTLPPMPSNLVAYYFLLVVAVAITLGTWAITRSRWGLGLKAILADEVAAEVTGIGTVAHKMAMFILSALGLGLTGGMIAWYWSYIDPYMAFDLAVSFDMLVMALFGGVGTVIGPLLGALVMTVLKEALSTSIPQFHTILFGVLVVGLVLWRPGGVIDLFRRWSPR
jgi:branched-chain amino acid transport system permease protein